MNRIYSLISGYYPQNEQNDQIQSTELKMVKKLKGLSLTWQGEERNHKWIGREELGRECQWGGG